MTDYTDLARRVRERAVMRDNMASNYREAWRRGQKVASFHRFEIDEIRDEQKRLRIKVTPPFGECNPYRGERW